MSSQAPPKQMSTLKPRPQTKTRPPAKAPAPVRSKPAAPAPAKPQAQPAAKASKNPPAKSGEDKARQPKPAGWWTKRILWAGVGVAGLVFLLVVFAHLAHAGLDYPLSGWFLETTLGAWRRIGIFAFLALVVFELIVLVKPKATPAPAKAEKAKPAA